MAKSLFLGGNVEQYEKEDSVKLNCIVKGNNIKSESKKIRKYTECAYAFCIYLLDNVKIINVFYKNE